MKNLSVKPRKVHIHASPVTILGLLIGVVMILSGIAAPNIRLIGAVMEENGQTMAIIENVKTKEQDVFDLGQNAFGTGEIIEIQDNMVVFEDENGQLVPVEQNQIMAKGDEVGNGQTGTEINPPNEVFGFPVFPTVDDGTNQPFDPLREIPENIENEDNAGMDVMDEESAESE
ncbi:MAG: hypothetical protein IT292_08435 [Deltaproteobacteria bacterium]|nr:hypothetical protein [Deltaproteobacteria bacterium]